MEFDGKKAAGPAGGFRGYQVSSGKAYLARYPAKHSTKAVTAEEGDELEQIHCHSISPYEVCAAVAATT